MTQNRLLRAENERQSQDIKLQSAWFKKMKCKFLQGIGKDRASLSLNCEREIESPIYTKSQQRMTLNNLHLKGAKEQPMIRPATEGEIAGACIEIHLELAEIWAQANSIGNTLLDRGFDSVNKPDLFQQAIELDGLSRRCADQRESFYSAVAKWFAQAGCPGNESEAIGLSHFAFGQKLYDFKTRCGVSPLAIDIVMGVRTEIETLHRNVIPNLVALVDETRHHTVPNRGDKLARNTDRPPMDRDPGLRASRKRTIGAVPQESATRHSCGQTEISGIAVAEPGHILLERQPKPQGTITNSQFGCCY